MDKYIGGFGDRDSVAAEFEVGTGSRWNNDDPFTVAADFPTDHEIIVAAYECAEYEGDAFVLYERGGVLFEVHGAHCSCYGLEGQWAPEETTREALSLRLEKGEKWGVENSEAVKALVSAYLGVA